MQFTDAVTVAGTRRRDDGILVTDVRAARTSFRLHAGHGSANRYSCPAGLR